MKKLEFSFYSQTERWCIIMARPWATFWAAELKRVPFSLIQLIGAFNRFNRPLNQHERQTSKFQRGESRQLFKQWLRNRLQNYGIRNYRFWCKKHNWYNFRFHRAAHYFYSSVMTTNDFKVGLITDQDSCLMRPSIVKNERSFGYQHSCWANNEWNFRYSSALFQESWSKG